MKKGKGAGKTAIAEERMRLFERYDLVPDQNRLKNLREYSISYPAYEEGLAAVLSGLDRGWTTAIRRMWEALNQKQAKYASLPVSLPNGQKATLACQKGCGHCCVLPVLSTPPEVATVAERLRERLSPEEMNQFLMRLKDTVAKFPLHSSQETLRLRTTCVFLQEGSCSIHAFRPMACRGFTSLDVRQCISQIPLGDPDSKILGHPGFGLSEKAMTLAYVDVCHKLGLNSSEVWFLPALEIALENPRFLEEWVESTWTGRESFWFSSLDS